MALEARAGFGQPYLPTEIVILSGATLASTTAVPRAGTGRADTARKFALLILMLR